MPGVTKRLRISVIASTESIAIGSRAQLNSSRSRS
jgi:hypothetical protein